jgi:hypothetical protein
VLDRLATGGVGADDVSAGEAGSGVGAGGGGKAGGGILVGEGRGRYR